MTMEIRDATEEDVRDISRIYVDAWRDTYGSFVPLSYLESMSYEKEARECMEFAFLSGRPRTLQVATVHGQVVGYVCAIPNTEEPYGYDAEVAELFVDQKWRGKGIGRRLMLAATEWAIEQGFGSMVVWCWADNPNRRFYESIGGKLLRASMQTVENTPLEALVFGWRMEKLRKTLGGGR